MAGEQSVMTDPSLLFSEQGVELLQLGLGAETDIVVPMVVAQWMDGSGDVDPELVLAPEDVEVFDLRLAQIRELAPSPTTFTHEEVNLDENAAIVLDRLLSSGDPAAFVWADEWAYLQSNSWLMSKVRRCLDAFDAAGVAILEFAEKHKAELIEKVIPADKVPAVITSELLLRVAVKWMVVGGASAAGGHLGAIAGTSAGGPIGTVLGHQLGRYAARKASTKAVLAIDP
jgi:hypothetical protein